MKSVQIRGFRIEARGSVMLKDMIQLYFAMKAHEGDPLAVEIMEAFEKEVKDADGKVIYAVGSTKAKPQIYVEDLSG